MKKYELEVTEENIKETIEKDYVRNKKDLMFLISLVHKIEENMTICIDGPWGCGKTFFINQFMFLVNNANENLSILKNEELQTIRENNLIIYYDAWKNDKHDDAFESIIFNILNEFPKYKDYIIQFPKIKECFEQFGKKYIQSKSKGFLNFDNISTYDNLAENIITQEEKKKDFEKLIGKILNGKRMILIIDELDRSNPLFASKVLETIKHFFDMENLTIIIVANNKELANTIKKQYGCDFDGYGYLNRFYDFIVSLDNSKNIEYSQKQLEFNETAYLPHNIAFEMFKKYNFSYRECNRYRVMYDLVKGEIERSKEGIFERNKYNVVFEIVLPIIIAMKIKNINNYEQTLNGVDEFLRADLEYIIEDFNKNGAYKGWIENYTTKISQEESTVDIIINCYNDFRENNMYSQLLSSCMRMCN